MSGSCYIIPKNGVTSSQITRLSPVYLTIDFSGGDSFPHYMHYIHTHISLHHTTSHHTHTHTRTHACIHAYMIIHTCLCLVRTLTPRPAPFHVFSPIYIYVCVCLHIHIRLHSLNFISGPHWDWPLFPQDAVCDGHTIAIGVVSYQPAKVITLQIMEKPGSLACMFYGVLVPPSLRGGSQEERERKHRVRRDREPRRLQMGWECSFITTKDGEQTPSMELDWTHLLLTCDYLCIYDHMFLGAHLAGQMPCFMRQWPPWGLDVLHTFV